MKVGLCLIFMVIHLFSSGSLFAEEIDLKQYIPSVEDEEWQLDGEASQAEGNELFMLINGGATLYLQLGFKRALIVTVKNKQGLQLNLDIYEMNSPELAQQANKEKIGENALRIEIGTEAFLEDYYINFWQGCYQITISGYDSSEESIKSITALAELVSRKVSRFDSGR